MYNKKTLILRKPNIIGWLCTTLFCITINKPSLHICNRSIKENVQNNPYIIGYYCELGISAVIRNGITKNRREAQR